MTTAEYFRTIYHRAVAAVGEAAWSRLTIHDQTEAIYTEFRAMDAEQFSKKRDTITG